MQHQLEVYFAAFKRPNPLAGIESKKTLPDVGLIKGSQKDRSPLKSIIGTTD
jgi:hypothetical protein